MTENTNSILSDSLESDFISPKDVDSTFVELNNPNSEVKHYSEETLLAVWEKGETINGMDEKMVRKDVCGAWIFFPHFQHKNSQFGWGIDHIYPKSKISNENGKNYDDIKNLRPMQIRNLESKGEDYPIYHYTVKADGMFNVEVSEDSIVSDELQEELKNLFS